ncbi:50S ribosomal protein L10 [Parasphaerochaeta coccoides]|uniref:Large ribosomal subunit protein uL10 n=1 Tax=Parasphaerochaeta coccoides (strain ATCC BAA-1237 / DSM 17374 / SPN1) TaxID=760011 RepID=F4GL90_PARC1|nr:50S ribosomal protein L10 [Parasphaerochaeta coccoides]AEC02922.1 50S ribosomal protein L10 [Parasphaerochaeta coccoides DSM 17374]
MAYETKITQAKEEAVKALKEEFSSYNSFIFTDYRGMSVEQLFNIRRQLLKNDAAYRVVKNRYAKIAFGELKTSGVDEHLVGPTAIALANGDEASSVAKVIFDMRGTGASIAVKGAVIDGALFDAAQVEAFSKLPSRAELLSSLLGTMKAPVQKLAATLLAYVESKGGKLDEAPAAVADETPAQEN